MSSLTHIQLLKTPDTLYHLKPNSQVQILVLPLANLENWTRFLTSLSLDFLVSNIEIIIVLYRVIVPFK